MGLLKNKYKTYNIFRYITFYFLIIVLITFVMGGYSYRFFYKTIYSDFMSGNEQHLSAVVSRHENDMQIVDDIVTQMGLVEEFTRFRLDEKPEYAGELKRYLKGYTTVSQFFDLLFYQYHKDEFLYHYLSSVSVDFFGNIGCSFENLTAEEFHALAIEENARVRILPIQAVEGDWISRYLSDDTYVLMFCAIPPFLQDTLIFMVPGEYYDQLLADREDQLRQDLLYYDGQIIVSRGSAGIPEEAVLTLFAGENLEEKVASGSVLQQEVMIGSEEYLLSAQQGKSGICYISLQSMEVYHDKMQTEQWFVVVLMLACIFFAVTIILFGSKNLVNKVKRLNELLDEESNYDLNTLENGIQTLVSTYKKSEKEGMILKKTSFIRNFIRGDFQSREDVLAEAQKAQLNIVYERYLVVLLKNKEANNENKTYAAMLDLISKEAELEGYGIHLINNNQNLFILYSDSQEVIESMLQQMQEIEKQYCQNFIFAVSDYHTDFTEGSKAYLEAVTAFDNYLLLDNSKIIRFSEVNQKEYVSLLPESYLQRLRYAIRTSDKKTVEVVVKDICGKLREEKVSLYAFRIFYYDIIQILLMEWKGDREEFDKFYNIFILSECLNIQEFGELLSEICNVIIDGAAGKEIKVSDIVDRAIAYMQENFQDPNLTMNAVAEYLEISSVTLSVEFKNVMDIRPTDYLGNLRIEKAKALLEGSNLPVREISLAVGYEDDRIFFRRFKKYTGMTPGQYRSGK